MGNLDLFEIDRINRHPKIIRLRDLKPINNLKVVFRDIRNYFAGNVTGITLDEKITQNIMRLLFCKIYDEKCRRDEDLCEFANRPNESMSEFKNRINNLFVNVSNKYNDIFESNERLELSENDLSYIVSLLEEYSLLDADRDVIADAFEELIGTSFRGSKGQFFTPRNVVQMMIDVLQPKEGERLLDPACGSGGFLAYTLKYFMEKNASGYDILGIDKDLFLVKIAKIYMSLIGNNNYHIFCENSLELPSVWGKETRKIVKIDSFDLILTNPPFGAKIPVVGRELLKQYKLGHVWKNNFGSWTITSQLLKKQPPQVLFIERCLHLLKDGGRLGIVLPDGIFGNPSDRYIWEYLSKEATILGIVSLSHDTFQPSTHTKTSVLFLKKGVQKTTSIFMAIANSVGHDKNGKATYKIRNDGSFIYNNNGEKIINDDLPVITNNFCLYREAGLINESHLGFRIANDDLVNHIYIPDYYNPEIKEYLISLERSGKFQLKTIGELVKENIIKITRGNEIGSQSYGTGEIPFVRTTDIVNWEIKVDPVKSVSEEIYNQYKNQQDISEGDILLVSDGTFLIGRTAMVTELDKKIVIQSHLRKIRVLDKEKINSYYLFYLLNSKIVKRQILSRTFIQSTISTLGNRLYEIILPIDTDRTKKDKIAFELQHIIEQKRLLRERSMNLVEKSV